MKNSKALLFNNFNSKGGVFGPGRLVHPRRPNLKMLPSAIGNYIE